MKRARNGWAAAAAWGSVLLLAGCEGMGGMFGGRDDGGGSATGTADAGTAGSSTSAGQASAAQVSAQDREFVMRAAQSGMAEVEASRAAVSKATSEEVRSFAQQMVRDHTATNEELMRIARAKGLQVTPQLDAEHRGKLDAMQALPPEEFERAYTQDMGVRAHQEAIELYERQAREGTDPDLRAFASRTLLALRQHLAMAEQVSAVAAKE
jgi:putative membrane protein